VSTKKSILIPSFKLSINENLNNPGVMRDVQIQQDGISLVMSKLFYRSELNFLPDRNSANSLFTMPLDEVVISSDFILAVINLEVLTEVNIPVVNVALIRENYFLKI
jgi:hypothetical protein